MNVKVENLSFSYKEKSPALSSVCFEITGSGITALIGPNGAGKSTLFKCMLNLEQQYSGRVTIDDKECKNLSANELSKLIAYVPQKNQNVLNYTVMDIVLMGMNNEIKMFSSPSKQQIEKAYEILQQMNIESFAQRNYMELSGGEQQLVLLCRSLVQKAGIILLDEPFSFLDYSNQIKVMKMLKKLSAEGMSIFYSTHNPNDVLQNADNVIALKKGKMIASGKTDHVMTDSLLFELYGTRCRIINTEDGKFIKQID